MRTAFFKALIDIAERDERVYLVVGDLGFGVVEPFQQRFPDRFLNAGVAEQNMTSIAAGLALSGKIVFTYSIGNFPTVRCLEQIRNDVCYHEANVKVVLVGGGFSYGALGMSHHATEDLAIMRAMPQMTVVAPGDPVETEAATRAVALHAGPCFLRLGRAGEPTVHRSPIKFELGKALVVRNGGDLTILSTGGMLQTSVEAAAILESEGVDARVVSMHTLKPIDHESILLAADETGHLITVEEHSVIGGLGSAVAEVLAESRGGRSPWILKRIGVPSVFAKRVGSQEYLRQTFGLTAAKITQVAKSLLSPATNRLTGSPKVFLR